MNGEEIMKKVVVLATIVLIFSVFAGRAYCEQGKAGDGATSTLRLIETYKAPPYPKEKSSDAKDEWLPLPDSWKVETYDFRKDIAKKTVPPTLTDTLVVDLWQRMTMDLKTEGTTPKTVSEDQVVQAINIYLQRDWKKIAGYRPWTHWNFIRSLTPEQRDGLAKDVVAYMHDSGVKEGN